MNYCIIYFYHFLSYPKYLQYNWPLTNILNQLILSYYIYRIYRIKFVGLRTNRNLEAPILQKCALEQVQVADEQLGRRETKHFCSIGASRFCLFIFSIPQISISKFIESTESETRKHSYLWPRSKCWIRANGASIQHAATKVTDMNVFVPRIRLFFYIL